MFFGLLVQINEVCLLSSCSSDKRGWFVLDLQVQTKEVCLFRSQGSDKCGLFIFDLQVETGEGFHCYYFDLHVQTNEGCLIPTCSIRQASFALDLKVQTN